MSSSHHGEYSRVRFDGLINTLGGRGHVERMLRQIYALAALFLTGTDTYAQQQWPKLGIGVTPPAANTAGTTPQTTTPTQLPRPVIYCGSKWYQRLGLQFLEAEQAVRGGYSFDAACQAHDACYDDCKTSKTDCDKMLRAYAEATCATARNKPDCLADAWIFFQKVSEVGDIPFKQARAQCSASELQEKQRKETSELREKQRKETSELREKQRKETSELREKQRKETSDLREKHQKATSELREKHRKETSGLREKQRKETSELQEDALPRGATVAVKIGQDVTTESGAVFQVVACAPFPAIAGTRPKNLDLKASTPSGNYTGAQVSGGVFPLLQEAIGLLTNTCSANALRLGGTVYVFVDRLPEKLPILPGAGRDDIRSRSHYLMAMGGAGDRVHWQIINGPSDWVRAEEEARRQAEARQKEQVKQAAAAQAAQREKQAADAAFDQFITRNKIVETALASKLRANPFNYEGKSIVVVLTFVEMRSASSAVFDSPVSALWRQRQDLMLVTDLPKTLFSTPEMAIMAVKVIGMTTMEEPAGKRTVPHLKYLGSIKCQREDSARCLSLAGLW